MRANLIKSIWIAVVTAVVLMLVTSPSTAAACTEMTADNFDSEVYQKEATVSPCCLTAECRLSHHVIANVVDSDVVLPERSTSKENIYIVWSATSVTTETSLGPQGPLQREPAQELPPCLHSEYHCRDCLDSEEPPQV